MSLHTDTVPVARESAGRHAAPAAGAAPRRDLPAALAAWLTNHDFPDVQSRGLDGVTPLMLAALHGDDPVVAALLDAGARIDALDDEGNHALWHACIGGAPAPILRLVGAGVEIDHANDHDITCLMQAAASGRVEVMQLLLSLGASEGLYAPDGRSAFDMAADRGFELLRTARRLGEGRRTASAAGSQIADPEPPAIAADVFADKAA
ncbi:ankyrin repeat protein [Paraburkholderia caballeronis]|uniref:ankyrin repeat domain-containing protein n=1 Tax=Paraburkholderia caballeronis TaxID=416943 RepID=UPI00106550BB|nr:ankyrin repeat domain-containing protein [Paraburkholderia caballeronis]TDV26878.1 ankyrin repeat protein [Paraburkholderia caballeronis]